MKAVYFYMDTVVAVKSLWNGKRFVTAKWDGKRWRILTYKSMPSVASREKAEENLRYATLGFREGVIATSNVLEAQTAWLSAQSEKIDAQIDVKLTEIYLKKSLGTLQ